MTEEEVSQCFTALSVFDETEEEDNKVRNQGRIPSMPLINMMVYLKRKKTTTNHERLPKKIYKTNEKHHFCVVPGKSSEYSLELMMPGQTSLEAFTCGSLGLSSSEILREEQKRHVLVSSCIIFLMYYILVEVFECVCISEFKYKCPLNSPCRPEFY